MEKLKIYYFKTEKNQKKIFFSLSQKLLIARGHHLSYQRFYFSLQLIERNWRPAIAVQLLELRVVCYILGTDISTAVLTF